MEKDHPTLANHANISNLENITIFYFSEITMIDQVLNNLKQLIPSKATGIDKIPDKVLKISADIIAPSLTAIFNLSLFTGIFVSEWKLARVQPIYKSEVKANVKTTVQFLLSHL